MGIRLTERVYESEVDRRRVTGKSCTRWLKGVQKTYNARLMELSDVKMMCMDRDQ